MTLTNDRIIHLDLGGEKGLNYFTDLPFLWMFHYKLNQNMTFWNATHLGLPLEHFAYCFPTHFCCLFFQLQFTFNIILVYSIVVRQSYTLQSVPSDISSTHLSYLVITILLTIFPVLNFTSLWLFCNYHFVLLNLFTVFTHSLEPLPIWQPSVCSLHL